MVVRQRLPRFVLFLLSAAAITGLAVSCGSPAAPAATATSQATVASTALSGAYSDPFTYCEAVQTIDTPDARYTGPRVPDSVIAGMQKADVLPTGTPPPPLVAGMSWRCMDSKVYACTVGANLPCLDKANTDKSPTQAMNDFCASNQNADVIPAAVTGHNTIYDWACKGATPEAVKQVFTPDARGYISDFWHVIQP